MKKEKWFDREKKHLASTDRGTVITYTILHGLVIVSLVRQLIAGDLFNAFLCIVALLLFMIPNLIETRLKIELPDLLECTIYIFIFAAEILGEINNFYQVIPFWDTILHTLNGFLCAAIGFSLVDLLNRNSKRISLSPIYLVLVSFSFSMTVGVCWEFFEYTMDKVTGTDMQKDTLVTNISSVYLNEEGENKTVKIRDITETDIITEDGTEYTIENGYLDIGLDDTMEDLFVNLIGAVTFNLIGYIYVRKRDFSKKSLAMRFVPHKMGESEEDELADLNELADEMESKEKKQK
jgi:hypothetical protein